MYHRLSTVLQTLLWSIHPVGPRIPDIKTQLLSNFPWLDSNLTFKTDLFNCSKAFVKRHFTLIFVKIYYRMAAVAERNQDATVYVGGLDDKVTEHLLAELFIQGKFPPDKLSGQFYDPFRI